MKILLVEDSPTLMHSTSKTISDAGHTPIAAESGEKALQLIEHTPVDMIVMDVEMPGLDGFETTRLIREWLGDHWVPIVFVTGRNDEKSYEEGIEAGGDDYLIKPISPVILAAKIKAMERITSMRDQMHKLNEKLETLSQIDGLTQIYNRRTFIELSKREWLKMSRLQGSVTVLMIDVDHFKLYNDHYGHPAGDACLSKVSQAIKQSLHRPDDLLGRYGGEEFIVFLANTDRWDSVHVAERIRQAVESLGVEHCKSPSDKRVSLSIGGAVSLQTTGKTLEKLIILADKALYQAKELGRNTVNFVESKPVKRVLVADKDPENLSLLCKFLGNHYQVLTSDDGEDCLNLAKQTKLDLILLNTDLPNLEGTHVCSELKKHSRTALTPILLLSDHEGEEQLQLGKDLGAKGCLHKPLTENRLLAKIMRYLQ